MGLMVIFLGLGMWLAIIILYLMFIKPLMTENERLKEEMHQRIKIGFYEELKQEEHE
jgi:type II secretory pathway component PulM